jgi:hypothetical protein
MPSIPRRDFKEVRTMNSESLHLVVVEEQEYPWGMEVWLWERSL